MSEKNYALSMLNNFAKPGAIFAMVADSYNIYDFVDMICNDQEIRAKIIAHGKSGGLTVIRPDSGDPAVVIPKLLHKLDKGFGSVVNDKGYKVLNYVRIIWGDGINELSIRTILMVSMIMNGFSADNLAFGMGGALLQIVNRDTQKFAMKCSAIYRNGEWIDVFKDPITDSVKKSKKGRFMIVKQGGEFKTVPYDEANKDQDIMALRYKNGQSFNEINFAKVRANTEM